jgi:hypothetical protein
MGHVACGEKTLRIMQNMNQAVREGKFAFLIFFAGFDSEDCATQIFGRWDRKLHCSDAPAMVAWVIH